MNDPAERIAQEDIFEIADRNPYVYINIRMYQQNILTWEQCLISCVIDLNGVLEKYEEQAEKHAQIIGKNDEALSNILIQIDELKKELGLV